jgi:hypothetical protein
MWFNPAKICNDQAQLLSMRQLVSLGRAYASNNRMRLTWTNSFHITSSGSLCFAFLM